ncbi:unnamed protein product, partial [marine sediment metagenome]
LRLSRKKQNQQSKRLALRCDMVWWCSPPWWACSPSRGDWHSLLVSGCSGKIAELFPDAKEGDTHDLYLSCWYREATP